MQDNEIAQLDRRLEQLIGADSMRSLLDSNSPQPPQVTSDVVDTDLEAEISRQQQSNKQLSAE